MIVKRVKDSKARFLQERHKQSKKIFDYEERYKELTKELKKKEQMNRIHALKIKELK